MSTEESFLADADGGRAFDKPVIIRESASDSRIHSIDSLVGELRDCYSALSVQVQDTETSKSRRMVMPDFLERVQIGQGSLMPVNLFNSFCAPEPTFALMRRFRLFDILARRAAAGGGDGELAGVDSSRGFSRSRLETDGAFAGPHVAFGGKWIRNLVGQKLIMFVPPAAMMGEWDTFARKGAEWCPYGKQLLFPLEPGDVCFIPHSHMLAQLAVGICASIEAPVWDARDTVEYLRSARWAAENRACADVPPLRRFDRILDALPTLVREEISRNPNGGWDLLFLHEITKVHAFERVLREDGGAHVRARNTGAGGALTGDQSGFGHGGGRGFGQEKQRRVSSSDDLAA